MNIYKNRIEKEIENIVQNTGFNLIELVFRGSHQKPVIEVFIDSKTGVSANDCAVVSKNITSFLDSTEFNFKDYRLDVSSPGIEKPLKFLWQYEKNIGRKFALVFLENEQQISLEANLVSINESNLSFETKGSSFEINFNQIISAKVLISF